MKNYIATMIVCILLLVWAESIAQITNKGAQITIKAGATLYTKSGLQNSSAGIITNSGTIVSDSFITNNSGCQFSGSGTYKVQGNWKNAGTYIPGTSRLQFFGKGNSQITSGGASVYDLQVDKNSNGIVNMLDALKVLNSIQFLVTKNWVQLNKNVLTLDSNCTITGYDSKKYFITNDTGLLKKINVGNTKFTFPVGFTKSTYNPLSITEAGTHDNYSVRSLQHALLNGGSGNAITLNGTDVSWLVKEGVAGGVNATIEAEWYPASGDQLPGFDSSKCMVVRYNGAAWDYNAGLAGLASGTTARTKSRSGVSGVGYFTVLSTANPTFQNAVAKVSSGNIVPRDIVNAQIRVYPTVVQNTLNISVMKNSENIQTMNVAIIDEAGRAILQKAKINFQSQQLSLSQAPSGMYFILIEYGGYSYSQKIIINH